MLGIGIACAFVIGILEFLWNCRKIAVETKVTQREALKQELLFALNFSINNKPVNATEPEPAEEENLALDFDEGGKTYSRQQSETISHKIKTISMTNLNKIENFFSKKNEKK